MVIVVHVVALERETNTSYMTGTTFLVTQDGRESLNKISFI